LWLLASTAYTQSGSGLETATALLKQAIDANSDAQTANADAKDALEDAQNNYNTAEDSGNTGAITDAGNVLTDTQQFAGECGQAAQQASQNLQTTQNAFDSYQYYYGDGEEQGMDGPMQYLTNSSNNTVMQSQAAAVADLAAETADGNVDDIFGDPIDDPTNSAQNLMDTVNNAISIPSDAAEVLDSLMSDIKIDPSEFGNAPADLSIFGTLPMVILDPNSNCPQ